MSSTCRVGSDAAQAAESARECRNHPTIWDKVSTVDIAVRDERGRESIVEMQCENHTAFRERMLYYGVRRYREQLRKGEGYDVLRPVLVIVFTNFTLLRSLPDYVHRFELRGVTPQGVVTSEIFSNHFRLVTVELPKFHASPSRLEAAGPQWVRFLKEGAEMSDVSHEPWETPELIRAREELARLSADPEMRALYERRLDYTRVLATRLRGAYAEGKAEGEARGKAQGEVRMAIRFRFPDAFAELSTWVERIDDLDALEAIKTSLLQSRPIGEIREQLTRAAAGTMQ